MDIEEIRKTFDRLNGFKKFVENEHEFGLKAKDFEITAITILCDLREDNLTIDFMPWIEALEMERAKNSGKYEIILKRDRTLTLPKVCKERSDNPSRLPLALKSLNDEDYKNFRGEFINVLDILYHASKSLYHECDRSLDSSMVSNPVYSENVYHDRDGSNHSRQYVFPFPLPYHGDVDDIANIFGKSF
jgi:hypothetical protein